MTCVSKQRRPWPCDYLESLVPYILLWGPIPRETLDSLICQNYPASLRDVDGSTEGYLRSSSISENCKRHHVDITLPVRHKHVKKYISCLSYNTCITIFVSITTWNVRKEVNVNYYLTLENTMSHANCPFELNNRILIVFWWN